MRVKEKVPGGEQKKRLVGFFGKKRTKDIIFICLMLLLPIAHFCVFWLGVNFSSLTLAFKDEYTDAFTFGNFQRFFDSWKLDWEFDGPLKYAVINTIIQIVIQNFVNMPLVIFVTFALFKKFYGHTFYRIVFYLPAIVGEVVMFTMQAYVLDATGPVVKIGAMFGINWGFDIQQTGLLGNDGSARLTFFITRIAISGSTILLLTGALNRVPKDLFDYAKIDGIGFFREFRYIALPLIWSTVGIMWVMSFATGWGAYNDVMLLTGGLHNTVNFGFFLMNSTLSATTGQGESFNYPAAIGLLMTAVIAPVTLLLRRLSEKLVDPVDY